MVSMVFQWFFEISRALVNRSLEVNNGMDVNVFGLHLQCAAMNIKDDWQCQVYTLQQK